MAVPSIVVIKHGLRREPMGGTSLPIGKGLLHLAAVREGVMYLRSVNVYPFNDKRYHVTLNTAAFQELIEAFTAADAADAGFERLEDSATPRYVFGGLRWETDPTATDLKIFGPKSDPANPYVIDLVADNGDSVR